MGLFTLAIAMIVYSWDIQKSKAGRRFEALRDYGFSKYELVNEEIEKSALSKNYIIDRTVYGLILLAFLFAFVTKLCLASNP